MLEFLKDAKVIAVLVLSLVGYGTSFMKIYDQISVFIFTHISSLFFVATSIFLIDLITSFKKRKERDEQIQEIKDTHTKEIKKLNDLIKNINKLLQQNSAYIVASNIRELHRDVIEDKKYINDLTYYRDTTTLIKNDIKKVNLNGKTGHHLKLIDEVEEVLNDYARKKREEKH